MPLLRNLLGCLPSPRGERRGELQAHIIRIFQAPDCSASRPPSGAWSCNPDARRCLPWWKSRCVPAIPGSASSARRWPASTKRSCA